MILGIQKTTLIDFPGKIACTIFLGGCNFRCGYCYNRDLVFGNPNLQSQSIEDFAAFLDTRKGILEGVCVTGGEPTLYPSLEKLLRMIKEKGFLVKLDTNGTNPLILSQLIEKKLIDYVAMDVKAAYEHYETVIGVKRSLEQIKQSVEMLKNSKINYEFRTTVIPQIHTAAEMNLIGNWIRGAQKYYIQNFRKAPTCIDPKFSEWPSFSLEELQNLKKIMEPYVENVSIRS